MKRITVASFFIKNVTNTQKAVKTTKYRQNNGPLDGRVNDDIILNIDGFSLSDSARTRILIKPNNVWSLK